MADAHETRIRSDLFIEEVSKPAANRVLVKGYLGSPNAKCVPDRRVKLYAVEDSGTEDSSDDTRKLVDRDRTSPNGRYLLRSTVPAGTDYVTIRLTPANIGSSGHRHICEESQGSYIP